MKDVCDRGPVASFGPSFKSKDQFGLVKMVLRKIQIDARDAKRKLVLRISVCNLRIKHAGNSSMRSVGQNETPKLCVLGSSAIGGKP